MTLAASPASSAGLTASRSGIVRINGRSYACGLFWFSPDSNRSLKDEVRRIAGQPGVGADLFCLRTTGKRQIGLGRRQDGHRQGIIAAATAVLDSPELADQQDWVAVFELPDGQGWWMVAVVQDVILSEQDLLFRNLEDAQAAFRVALSRFGFRYFLLPEGWDVHIPGAQVQSSDIQKLLSRPRSKARLRPVKGGDWRRVAILAVVAAAFGAYLVKQRIDEQEAIEQARLELERQGALVEVPVKPWQQQPDAAGFFDACLEAMLDLAVTVPGWTLEMVSCDGTAAAATWRQAGGTLGWILAAAEALGREPILRDQARVAVVNLPLANRAPRQLQEEPLRAHEIERRMRTSLEAFGARTTITPSTAPAPIPGRIDAPAPWRSMQFDIEAGFSVEEWAPVISSIPAVVPEALVWNPSTSTWTAKGLVYEQNDVR